MHFQGTDIAVMLQPYCFLNPRDISSPPTSPLGGNTELRVNYWINCGVPIGTLVVVGMTGVVHCRRRWEVRCMKEWEARELQLRDQRKTKVTRKCLLQANLPRTETQHAY